MKMSNRNSLIFIPLSILLVLSFISLMFGNTLAGISIDDSVSIDALINGTETSVDIGGTNATLSLDPLQGAIIWIIIILGIGVAVGIQVLGSGLSDKSVHLLFMGIFFSSVWGILSVLSMNLIESIEVFGSFIYLGLTIVYAIGTIIKVGEG